MPEYWEEVQQRAMDTCAVWDGHNAAFTVGQLTLAGHRADMQSLESLAQAVSAAEVAYGEAVEAKEENLRWIAGVNVRGLAVLQGNLEGTGVSAAELGAVSGIVNKGGRKILARGRLLTAVWEQVNGARAASSPALPPVLAGTIGVGELNAAVEGHEAHLQSVTERLSDWNVAREALRVQARKVDGNNKRWYAAWSGFYVAGSPEYEAREQIQTEKPGQKVKTVVSKGR